MPVRSRRLFGAVRVTVGPYTKVYEVPAGRTAIIRSLRVANPADAAAWPISLRLSPGATGTGVLFQRVLAAGETLDVGLIILNPLDVLWGRSNAAGTPGIDCYGFGSLLLGVPE